MKLQAAARLAATEVKAAHRGPAVTKLYNSIRKLISPVAATDETIDAWLCGGHAPTGKTADEVARLVKNLKYKKVDLIGDFDDSLEDALKEKAFGTFTDQEINEILDYANDE